MYKQTEATAYAPESVGTKFRIYLQFTILCAGWYIPFYSKSQFVILSVFYNLCTIGQKRVIII